VIMWGWSSQKLIPARFILFLQSRIWLGSGSLYGSYSRSDMCPFCARNVVIESEDSEEDHIDKHVYELCDAI